jgi:hypothetical protein
MASSWPKDPTQIHQRIRRAFVIGRLVGGAVFVGVGVLWTLDNLGVAEAGRVLHLWPALLLAFGVSRMTGVLGRRTPIVGVVFTFVGGLMLLQRLGILSVGLAQLWPIALILVGLSMVFRRRETTRVHISLGDGPPSGGPHLRAVAVMSGVERSALPEPLSAVELVAVMGGVELDLRQALPPADHAAILIDTFSLMGGIVLVVPDNWRVVNEVNAVMGGAEDRTVAPVGPVAATVVVRGVVFMGGIEIRNSASSGPRSRRMRHAASGESARG